MPSKIYNIGGFRAYTLNEIVAAIQNVTGKTADVVYTDSRKLDVPINYLDISLISKELGWVPKISLEQGISLTSDWLNSTGHIK